MSLKRFVYACMLVIIIVPQAALAHHGGVSLAFGPGSPIESNSPLTLPQGAWVLGARFEQVEWKKYDWAEPENKDSFSFFNLSLSHGITPYLTGSIFFPYNIKRQDTLGQTEGIGDIRFLFNLGLNYDPSRGGVLNTAEDTTTSMEGTKKTFIGFSAGFTIPTGDHETELGGELDRGMQPGFGSPTMTFGLSAAKMIADGLTLVADTSYDIFTKKDNFKFGNEWRLNLAGVYVFFSKPDNFLAEIDGIAELNLLNVAKDEEGGDKQRATGGTILYASPGLRFSLPKLGNANLGVMMKFPVWKDLNEKDEQQGAEGLEKYRAIVTLSFFF